MSKVYLAGPISGLSYDQAVHWRREAAIKLSPASIQCLSPMRDKTTLQGAVAIGRNDEAGLLGSQRAIFCRDHYDVCACDVVLMNLRDACEISIGTMIEIGWATAYRKPIVLVMELCSYARNVHDHPFVRQAVDFVVNDLDTAITIIESILAMRPEEAP
jgi:nucleoside 2-deoxyribosyltransferase